jgi:hypothetical protein
MKRDSILIRLCGLALYTAVSLFPMVCLARNDAPEALGPSSNPAGGLRISLATDKAIYARGDEIHFEVVFFNAGQAPFRILLNTFDWSSGIACTDAMGEPCAQSSGFCKILFKLKPGAYLGKTRLLKPNEKVAVQVDALLDGKYQMIFGEMSGRKGPCDYQALKREENLPADFPDKYISVGKIWPLLKPGKYRFAYVYETTEADTKWWSFSGARTPEEASVDLLWIGKAASNPIELLLE